MECPLCGHEKAHKHGKTSKGGQRYLCPNCDKTFTDTFDTIHYKRHIDSDEIRTILQSHTEGSSLRGISRITQRAYGTVVSLVKADERQKAQIVHNAKVQKVETDEVSADEMWSFVEKNKKTVEQKK